MRRYQKTTVVRLFRPWPGHHVPCDAPYCVEVIARSPLMRACEYPRETDWASFTIRPPRRKRYRRVGPEPVKGQLEETK